MKAYSIEYKYLIILLIFFTGFSSCLSGARRSIPFPDELENPEYVQSLFLRDFSPEEESGVPEASRGGKRSGKKQKQNPQASDLPSSGGMNLNESPDEKGRPVRTDFTAAELIRETVSTGGTETVRITLRGGATIIHNHIVLRAPLIRIDGGTSGVLTGGISLEDRQSGTVIRAARADYSRQEQKVILTGLPQIAARTDDGKTALITSVKMIQDLAGKISYLEGDLRIIHERSSLIGDKGIFYNDTKVFEIEKNPVFIGPDHYASGKKIIYNMELRTLEIADHPVVLLRGDDTDIIPAGGLMNTEADETQKKSSGNEKVTTAVSAETVYYRMKTDFMPVPRLELRKSAVITRKGFTLKAPSLVSEGESLRYFTGRESVDITDLDQNVKLRSPVMIYDRDKGFLRMEDGGEIGFLDKDTKEISGVMKASVIESDLKERIIKAYGAVTLMNKEYTAVGERAFYSGKDNVIILEGNPGLVSGKSTVYSDKILIYPQTGQIKMESGLRGKLSD